MLQNSTGQFVAQVTALLGSPYDGHTRRPRCPPATRSISEVCSQRQRDPSDPFTLL
jgi:hypothetical protein